MECVGILNNKITGFEVLGLGTQNKTFTTIIETRTLIINYDNLMGSVVSYRSN